MIANDLPAWLPIFNMVAAGAALILAIPGLRSSGWTAAYRVAMAVALVVLLAGAMFQANILPLWAWVIFGSGGRLLILATVVAGTVASGRTVERVSLNDLVALLDNIRVAATAASDSAERAYAAATAADDRVISQSERAVDDRARGIRIEDAIAENTDLTKTGIDQAHEAYEVANDVNGKIASQGAALVAQGAAAEEDRARVVRIEDVSTDTNVRAKDIQERLP